MKCTNKNGTLMWERGIIKVAQLFYRDGKKVNYISCCTGPAKSCKIETKIFITIES